MKITLAHGSGGKSTTDLIDAIFGKHFSNPVLNLMDDCAVVDGSKKIAVTTDSFVVEPLFFKGGDIGRLSVCGTVNDLLMRGAVPKYITSAFIIEEGADTNTLEKIVISMAETAREAGVMVIAGDTKVIEGSGGVYINTTGVGFVNESTNVCCKNVESGDSLILTGTLGDHHCAILSHRMEIENNIHSDCAPLNEIVLSLIRENIPIHAMRDVTRGGLGTVLNELANSSECKIEIYGEKIPVSKEVEAFCKILGLDIMHTGNEGKAIIFVPKEYEKKALEIIKKSRYGENASIIGSACEGQGVELVTKFGSKKTVGILYGEGLPRIC